MARERRWDEEFLRARDEHHQSRDFERRRERDWKEAGDVRQRYFGVQFRCCRQRVCRRARRCMVWPPVCPPADMSADVKQDLLKWIYAGIQEREMQKALGMDATEQKR